MALDEKQRRVVHDTLAVLAEERVRLADDINRGMKEGIRMNEAQRKLERAYNDLRDLLREDSPAKLGD
jgi:hypothetical protein